MYHLRNKQKGLSIFLIIMILVGVILSTGPVFAEGALSALTLDSENFTLIGVNNDTFTITAKGLDSSWLPTAIDGSKVRWSTSDESVATISNTTGETTTVTLHGNIGEAVVTASYADEGVQSVPSNVFIESQDTVDYVKKITVRINDGESVNQKRIPRVKSGPIKETTKTFQTHPTALHALVKAYNYSTSPIVTSYTIDPSGFVMEINGKVGEYIDGVWNGWTYTVNNGTPPAKGAGVYEIHDRDKVTWTYGPMSF